MSITNSDSTNPDYFFNVNEFVYFLWRANWILLVLIDYIGTFLSVLIVIECLIHLLVQKMNICNMF